MKESIRLLHLEDSLRDAELARDHLEADGLVCTIVLARDRNEFERALEAEDWDLVISDYRLPTYDGLAALKHVRDRRPLLPIILLSGSMSPEAAASFVREGATDYILKQRPERLASAVRRALAEVEERRKRTRIEEALQESEERLRLAFAATHMEAWDLDLTTGRVRVSKAGAQSFDPRTETDIDYPSWLLDVHPEDAPERARAFDDMLREGHEFHIEHRVVDDNGVLRWVAVWGTLIRDESGAPKRVIGVSQDISARKAGEAAILASLSENEALLREVHHRVNNNLQVIASLLRLEARKQNDAATSAALDGMKNRVYSMALLYETLHRSGDLARVDLSSYLGNLMRRLFRSLEPRSRQTEVQLRLDLTPVRVSLDQAISCGLIVNELASNSLRHGLPAGTVGGVSLEVRCLPDGAVCLTVEDTGSGLPADFDARRARSLGLQLVEDLVRQLNGRLEIGPGTAPAFRVTFDPRDVGHAADPPS